MNETTKPDLAVNDGKSLDQKTETKGQSELPTGSETLKVGDTETVFLPQEDEVEEWPVAGASQGDYVPGNKPTRQENEGQIGSDFWDKKDDWDSTVVGALPGGKEIQIKKNPNGTGYFINCKQGSPVAPELKGMWTSFHLAEVAIKAYLGRKHDEANAKSTAE